jgi:CubicO group peptidase (beta-lactamase class C family)
MIILDPSAFLFDLGKIAESVVAEHQASPCAVVAAAIRRNGRWERGIGAAGRLWSAEGAPAANASTLFDLASVTKPLTALTFARLVRSGHIALSEPLAEVLPQLAATRSARVPLELFAAHRAGLDAHRTLYAPLLEGRPVEPAAALLTAADARRDGCDGDPPPEGFPPVYSDLGYLLLGAALAARGGDELDRVLDREVIAPLGLSIGSARRLRARDGEGEGDGGGFDARVAATEVVPWRGGMVRGAVHDENAWAIARDGAAGHAGLFGDARSVLALGEAVLDALAGRRPGWLEPDDLAPLVRARPGGSLLAGFDRKSGEAPSSGARFGPATFGHLGFTGTSLWMDPDAEMIGVLLTNRVHPTRESLAIRKARPSAYDAIVEAIT